MLHMQEMFGEDIRAAWTIAVKNFTNTKMVEGTSMKDHVVKMISYANKFNTLGAEINIILASLS